MLDVGLVLPAVPTGVKSRPEDTDVRADAHSLFLRRKNPGLLGIIIIINVVVTVSGYWQSFTNRNAISHSETFPSWSIEFLSSSSFLFCLLRQHNFGHFLFIFCCSSRPLSHKVKARIFALEIYCVTPRNTWISLARRPTRKNRRFKQNLIIFTVGYNYTRRINELAISCKIVLSFLFLSWDVKSRLVVLVLLLPCK